MVLKSRVIGVSKMKVAYTIRTHLGLMARGPLVASLQLKIGGRPGQEHRRQLMEACKRPQWTARGTRTGIRVVKEWRQ